MRFRFQRRYPCGRATARQSLAAFAKRVYTDSMRTAWKKIRYRLEWLEFGLGSEWGYRGSKEKFSFLSGLEIQCKQTRRFIELSAMNTLLLLVIAFLFLSGPDVNAGPVGNFFKKVGQSISKPLQRQPEPQPQSTSPQPAKTQHATRRPTSRAAPPAAATPHAAAQTSQPPKEEPPKEG
jgi:hypothetical protein